MVALGRASLVMQQIFVVNLILGVSKALPTLNFVGNLDNDVLVAAKKGNLPVKNFPTVAAALAAAKHGDGLLVMADGMHPSNPGVPQSNTTTTIAESEWKLCEKLSLRVYVEFPSRLPAPGSANLSVAQTLWQRVVVAPKGFTVGAD